MEKHQGCRDLALFRLGTSLWGGSKHHGLLRTALAGFEILTIHYKDICFHSLRERNKSQAESSWCHYVWAVILAAKSKSTWRKLRGFNHCCHGRLCLITWPDLCCYSLHMCDVEISHALLSCLPDSLVSVLTISLDICYCWSHCRG